MFLPRPKRPRRPSVRATATSPPPSDSKGNHHVRSEFRRHRQNRPIKETSIAGAKRRRRGRPDRGVGRRLDPILGQGEAAYTAAVNGLNDRIQDENKGLMTVSEAETLIAKPADGPGVDVKEENATYTKKIYSWSGLLKSYALTAYYTKGSEPGLHHFETEDAKYTPETPAVPVPSVGHACYDKGGGPPHPAPVRTPNRPTHLRPRRRPHPVLPARPNRLTRPPRPRLRRVRSTLARRSRLTPAQSPIRSRAQSLGRDRTRESGNVAKAASHWT